MVINRIIKSFDRVLMCALGMLIANTAMAQFWNAPYPPPNAQWQYTPPNQPAPNDWQFRPVPSNNARGIPPNYAQPAAPWSNYPPNQFAPTYSHQSAIENRPPRVEAELSTSQAYIEEVVLLTLRVVSDGNLLTVTPQVELLPDVVIQSLQDPVTHIRGAAHGGEIITTYLFTLRPQRVGDLSLGPVQVTGTDANHHAFTVATIKSLQLQVRPAMNSIKPWLPLRGLTLQATLDGEADLIEGQPVTLIIETRADGTIATQLPSLETQLQSKAFRVYREQTLINTQLTADSQRLLAQRTEYYTLVPRMNGRLQLPDVALQWWNLESGRIERSQLTPREFYSADHATWWQNLLLNASTIRSGWWWSITALGLILFGYWGGRWLYQRQLKRVLRHALLLKSDTLAVNSLVLHLRRLAIAHWWQKPLNILRVGVQRFIHNGWFLLQHIWQQLRQRLWLLLPVETRFYYTTRTASLAPTPELWQQFIQQQVLDTFKPAPGYSLAERFIQLRPSGDAGRIRQLCAQLEAALYYQRELDWPRWKVEFQHALRPLHGGWLWFNHQLWRRGQLPELNPHLK
ncbi:BatD family protein [Thiospirillum jenense]|uniref:BatD family protein n=1 Tax=Thiospirillum jenense TaxID=1653858 RepID=A0A839HKK1_9GAMM|nr:BatD family protein [Thiospirillum jenense]MBB1127157.1 BatD family protein [Thiospirillum jenense]